MPLIEKCHTKEGRYKPNGFMDQCQCVMHHSGCFMDKTIEQCHQPRHEESNLFCRHCEEMHGDAYRAKYGGSK
jgi:hypothetical protein